MIRYAMAAALLALPQAAAAQANACLTRAEVRTLIVFATPSLVEAASRKCAAALPADSFLRTGAGAMVERLRGESKAEAGSIITVIEKLAGEKMPSGLSEETTQSLVRDIVGAELAKDIDPKNCGTIDAVASSLSPLPASNIATLTAALLELGAGKDKKAPFRICEG